MGYQLRREVVGRTRATHLRLLVYLALADAANDEDHKLFGTMEAWPSQGRLAWELNSSRRAIGRALAELEAAGEIRDTGRKKGRGCVVYELTPPEPKAPYDAAAEYVAPTPKSATVADPGEGGFSPTPILAPPTPILVDPPTPTSAPEPTPKSATEPEGEPELGEPEKEHTPAPTAPAVDAFLLDWSEQEVEYDALIRHFEADPERALTLRAIEEIELGVVARRLGVEGVVAG